MVFLLVFLMNLFDFYILDQYYFCFTKERKKADSITAILLLACAFALSIVNDIGHPGLNLVCSVFLIYLYGGNYKLPRIYYFLLPVFYLGIGFVTEPIGVLLLNCLTGLFPNTSKVICYFVSVMLCEFIRFLIVIMIKNYWNGKLMNLPLKINILLCSIPTLGIISCCIIIRTVLLYDMPEEGLLCAGIIFMVLFSNILVFAVFKRLNKMYMEMHQNEMIVQEAKLKEEYYLKIDKSSQHLRKIRHDLKNRLVGIYAIEGNEELMRSKIKEIIGELEEGNQNLYTANCVLNSVLNIKYKAAISEKIKVQNDIMVPKYMNIDYEDMGVLFGNLLDNAIEANRLVGENDRWIDVSVDYEDHILVINIKNSKIPGVEKKKKDYLNHGIGLNSVREIVEKYNGFAEFQDLGNVFESSAILYGIRDDKDFEKEVKVKKNTYIKNRNML